MPQIPPQQDGKLADNILHFARALRAAGMRVGSGRAVDAVRAVEAAGFTRREDFYWSLFACFVSRPEDLAAFDAVFRLFWRDPQALEKMLAQLMSETQAPAPKRAKTGAERRAEEAMRGDAAPPAPRRESPEEEEIEIDARFTLSSEERLRRMDFEQMSAAELAAARRALARLRLPAPASPGRRLRPDPRGRAADWRATIRKSLRRGGEPARLETRARDPRRPELVALCDISGSMGGYSRMLLHFLHAVGGEAGPGGGRGRVGFEAVHSFVFGTRLTNITRHLRHRDVDQALARAGAAAQDWEGGTRIGACLHAFNRDWSRRVMARGAVLLLITDGLERDEPELLERAAARLGRTARRFIWLNPLLRWEGYEPRARGARALLPHVHSFRAAHNVESLETLVAALSAPEAAAAPPGRRADAAAAQEIR